MADERVENDSENFRPEPGSVCHAFHWPRLSHMAPLIARETGQCSLAVCPGGT